MNIKTENKNLATAKDGTLYVKLSYIFSPLGFELSSISSWTCFGKSNTRYLKVQDVIDYLEKEIKHCNKKDQLKLLSNIHFLKKAQVENGEYARQT